MTNELEDALANRSIGPQHNNPPTDAEILKERLDGLAEAALRRRDELLAAMARLPANCDNPEMAAKLTSFGAQLKANLEDFESLRKTEKRKFDEMGSVVQSFFQNHKSVLEVAVGKVKEILLAYQRGEERKRQAAIEIERHRIEDERRAEAEKLAKEAVKLEAAGMKTAAEATLTQASLAENEANQAMQLAVAAAPEKTPLRGSVGGSASTQGRWAVRITDFDKIDMQALAPYFDRAAVEKALRELMRQTVKKLGKNEAAPVFAGFEFYKDESISLRG